MKRKLALLLCVTTLAFVGCGETPQKPDATEPTGTVEPEKEDVEPEKADADNADNADAEVEAEPTPGEIIASCVPLDGFTICGVPLAGATRDALAAATDASEYDKDMFQGNFGYLMDKPYAFTVDGFTDGQEYLVNTSDGGYVAMFISNFILFMGNNPDSHMPARSEYSFPINGGDSIEKIAPILELEDGSYESPFGTVTLTKDADNGNVGSLSEKKLMFVNYGPDMIKIFYDDSGIFYVEPNKRL